MPDRSYILPLVVGFLLAVTVHVLAAPNFFKWLDGETIGRIMRIDPANPAEPEPPTPQPDKPRIGQEKPGTTTVNLLSYEDYRELLARNQAPFDQPMMQQQVDPDDQAQETPLDPTPPDLPLPVAEPTPPAPSPPPTQATAAATPPLPASDPLTTPLTTDIASDTPDLIDALIDPAAKFDDPQAMATAQAVPTMPSPPTPPVPPAPAAPPAPPAAAQQAKPTAAPRTDAESPPASRLTDLSVKPGEVITQQGIRIRTVVPRFDTVATMTTAPRDPVVTIVFDHTGKVIKATMSRSSGYANIDSPILNAIYKWTAEADPLPPNLVLDNLRIYLGVEKP